MPQDVLSITQLNNYIRDTIDRDHLLNSVAVRGEISNYKIYPSGHHYFTLKDENSALRCVMFKGNTFRLRFRPENGMKVIAIGKISVYPRDGAYQLYCTALTVDGVGDLHVAFEQLKEKLSKEGLFDPTHKKKLPQYPKTIGIVTSSAGAAIHDILRILRKRYPLSKVRLFPVRVQGVEAPPEIVGAIRYANRHQLADLLIVGRGGGSIEDLWGFNDEGLAREIFTSEIPVVSAVGHEVDFTISDFVSDLRAPTPSAAAEIVFPNNLEMIRRLSAIKDRAEISMQKRMSSISLRMSLYTSELEKKSPVYKLRDRTMRISALAERLEYMGGKILDEKQSRMKLCAARLVAVNPMAVLSKGYTLVESKEKGIISSVSDLSAGEKINLVFSDGVARATVESASPKEK